MKANFETGLKICGHCKRELPIEMFYKSSRTSDGLSCSCNDCRKEYRQSQSGREVSKKARIKHTQKYSENNTKKAKVPDNVEEIVEFLRKEINNEILYRN